MIVTTIGNIRMPVSDTARAPASSDPPRASWSASTTWAGNANNAAIMNMEFASVNPASRASAPKPRQEKCR